MNIVEKIIANHSNSKLVKPGDFVDIFIDVRAARDFGGANVVKNIIDNGLGIADPTRTFFTFDCNPGGSDQKYAANQQYCRLFARENDIMVFDVDAGIGTHIAIDKGLALPGSTFVSTDSHASVMGAIGSFGQGMGDQDIAATFAKGSVWFKVPPSIKIIVKGTRSANVTAKDIVLNFLKIFGTSELLNYSVEVYGDEIEKLTLDERITISSMAAELGAIIIFFKPSEEIIKYCEAKSGKKVIPVVADANATYDKTIEVDISTFKPMLAMPGHPHNNKEVMLEKGKKIDSAFIGSCTNGRIEDLRTAASILKGKKIAPGVVLKIVPATDEIWKQSLNEGLINIFKEAGAMVSNAGCAGCAAGQVGQNGPEEVTISTGNRNFAGKQGKGQVYLASPAIVASSALAGYITTPDQIPAEPVMFTKTGKGVKANADKKQNSERKLIVEGRVWLINQDDIDTDMIYHNRYLTITDIAEMGKYAFDNLKGYEDFAKKAKEGDIIITGNNFGCGSSRQQAVDCFVSLASNCIIAKSFGAIYERNAINAAFPILTYNDISSLELKDGDTLRINYETGELTNINNNKSQKINPFYEVQKNIYLQGGLLG